MSKSTSPSPYLMSLAIISSALVEKLKKQKKKYVHRTTTSKIFSENIEKVCNFLLSFLAPFMIQQSEKHKYKNRQVSHTRTKVFILNQTQQNRKLLTQQGLQKSRPPEHGNKTCPTKLTFKCATKCNKIQNKCVMMISTVKIKMFTQF